MEPASLIMSILAVIGSLFTYFYHDRKIKLQEVRIKAHELSKIDDEKTEALQAKVRANCYESGTGKRTIKIFNSGRAIARNIRIDFIPSEFNDTIRMNNFPYPYLNPQDSTEIYMFLHTGLPYKTEIKMMWDDDYGVNNMHTQIITL